MCTPNSIAKKIMTMIAVDAHPDSIENHLLKIDSSATAQERKIANDKESLILDRLRRKHNEMHENGEFCLFAFNTSSVNLIQGCCYIEKNDTSIVVRQKENCLNWNKYALMVDDLTPDEFEQLSKKLISLLGGSDVICTRHSADEGIDFVGKLNMAQLLVPELPFQGLYAQASVWIVGQSKQYKSTPISTPIVRELVGSVMLLRYGVLSSDRSPFENVAIRPLDPIFHLIMVTGHITKNTKKLLTRSGVGFMDREMLSSHLATNEVAKINEDVDEVEFKKWLTS